MDRGLLVGLCLLCCLSAGEALTCYYCPFGLCFLPTTQTCDFGQMCATFTGTVSSGGVGMTLKSKGCLGALSCLTSSTESYNGIDVSVSPSCCLGSLCNAGSMAKLSLLAGLVTLMATLLMTFL